MSVEYIPHVFSGTNGRPIGARGIYARARYGSDVTQAGAFRRLKNITT
jgi:predicted phage gp36 major capsid-like protein